MSPSLCIGHLALCHVLYCTLYILWSVHTIPCLPVYSYYIVCSICHMKYCVQMSFVLLLISSQKDYNIVIPVC